MLAHQLAIVIVTQQHGAVATIEIGFHPHRGGLAADLALFSGHADAPVKIDLTRRHRSRRLDLHLVFSEDEPIGVNR
nr:hypothetical protein [Stenotrophomonas indicatrix]